MKALVTGAGGFVGSHLVRELREAGWRVLTSDRHGEVDFPGDLLQIPLRTVSVDVVFHLAGFANPSASLSDPADAWSGNAVATARVAREVRAGRIVVASTGQVYGPRSDRTPETAPVSPRTPYAASKLCGEALALASGKEVIILRPYNHTGPGQSDAYVCPSIARQIARAESGRGPRVVRLGALEPRRDFFDVRDMARAYRLAAEKARPGEIYNVATGRPVPIGEVLRLLLSQARVKLRVRARHGRPDVMTGDSSKFRAATGWAPKIPLSRTLRDLLDYERARTK
jgi:GDP-4-dehydro-6-deoxy-D-mannose reductase